MNEKIEQLINKFQGDIIMLDALYQWATNPTSPSAVKNNNPPNHDLIKSNLKIRYELDQEKTEKIYKKFIEVIEATGFDFLTGYLEAKEGISQYFEENAVLRDEVLKRLDAASDKVKCIAWLFCKVREIFELWSEYHGYGNDKFLAILNATFDISATSAAILPSLIELGFLNELHWIGSNYRYDSSKKGNIFSFPYYLEPIAENIEEYITLPENRDFKRFVNALFERKRVKALVGIEEILEKKVAYEGEISCELPIEPFIIGRCNSVIAVNWSIYDALRKYFFERKLNETSRWVIALQQTIDKLKDKYYPDISTSEEHLFDGVAAWKIKSLDESLSEKGILIIHTPWLTGAQVGKINLMAWSKLLPKHGMYIVSFLTMMGIPDLYAVYEKVVDKNIKEKEGELDWIILDCTKDKIFEKVLNKKPKIYDEIIEGLRKAGFLIERESKSANDEKQEDISKDKRDLKPREGKAKESTEKEIKPIESPHSVEVADAILLGEQVSITELTELTLKHGLTEDEQREKLVAEASFFYPLSAAATHTAIFGITGSGKSVTTKRLVYEFVSHKVPVMIIDWHDEYTDIIRSLNGSVAVPPTATRKAKEGEIPFTWNILDPRFYSEDITLDVIDDYIGIVVDLLSHKDLMDLSEPMVGGLIETLRLAYKEMEIPTFLKLDDLVEQVSLPPTTADALKRRLQRFSSGSLGKIFCTETSFNPQEIYTKPICIRVKHLTSDHRSAVGLLTYFVLQQTESYFKRLGETNQLRHAIIIDEAPMVIGSNPKIERTVVRILQELRKFGEGLVLVCRNPGISDDIMRETNQKIAHKLDLPKDVNAVSNMLGLSGNDKGLIHKLPRGVAFARIAGNPTTLIRIKAT